MVLLVFFSTNRAHALDLYLVFMSRTHLKQSMEESVDSTNFNKCSELVKLKSKLGTKTDLVEEGDITIRGIITRILILRANQGTWSMNFTRRSLVRRTYNTESSLKELAWGRSILMYPGKYSFPFVLVFSIKKMNN